MIKEVTPGAEVWVIIKYSYNANKVSEPVRGTVIGLAPQWVLNPHVKLTVAGKPVTVPQERCFDDVEVLKKFLCNVLEERKKMTETAYRRYLASQQETDKLSTFINNLS